MSVSWPANFCKAGWRRTITDLVTTGERPLVSLAIPGTMDCTACLRSRPTCVSSLPGTVAFTSIAEDALAEVQDWTTGEIELLVHRLVAAGHWEAVANLAVRWPLTVAPLVAASDISFDEVAESGAWDALWGFFRAGVLSADITAHLQRNPPTSVARVLRNHQLHIYCGWLRQEPGYCKPVATAVTRALTARGLPDDLVALVFQFIFSK